jgi:hypothetical protein
MTAVHQNNFQKQHPSENQSLPSTSAEFKDIGADMPLHSETPVLASGFLYLLASIQKARAIH